MPVILYAEFTAKPGSESQVETLISGLAEKVRGEPGNTEFTVYRERDNPRKFFVFEQYLDEASFDAHISAEYGLIFNQQLSSLIEEGESQLTWLTRVAPPYRQITRRSNGGPKLGQTRQKSTRVLHLRRGKPRPAANPQLDLGSAPMVTTRDVVQRVGRGRDLCPAVRRC